MSVETFARIVVKVQVPVASTARRDPTERPKCTSAPGPGPVLMSLLNTSSGRPSGRVSDASRSPTGSGPMATAPIESS
jgi:hypothetical protein